MSSVVANLPDDIDALRALCARQAAEPVRQSGKLQARDRLIDKLKEQLAVLPRARFVCKGCDNGIAASMPSLPVERGRPGPGLIAHVLAARYCDHLPPCRQPEIYAREGVELARSTMAGWVGTAGTLMAPLIGALRAHVFAGDRLRGDDTPVPVLHPGKGKTKTGRLWTCVRDGRPCGSETPPAVCYFYSPDRKGEHPKAHPEHFHGVLHADGYAGFRDLYAKQANGPRSTDSIRKPVCVVY